MQEIELAHTIAVTRILSVCAISRSLCVRVLSRITSGFLHQHYTVAQFNNPENSCNTFSGRAGISRWTVAEEAQFKALTTV